MKRIFFPLFFVMSTCSIRDAGAIDIVDIGGGGSEEGGGGIIGGEDAARGDFPGYAHPLKPPDSDF